MLKECCAREALFWKSAQAQAQAQMLIIKISLKAPSSTPKKELKVLSSTSTQVLAPCLTYICTFEPVVFTYTLL